MSDPGESPGTGMLRCWEGKAAMAGVGADWPGAHSSASRGQSGAQAGAARRAGHCLASGHSSRNSGCFWEGPSQVGLPMKGPLSLHAVVNYDASGGNSAVEVAAGGGSRTGQREQLSCEDVFNGGWHQPTPQTALEPPIQIRVTAGPWSPRRAEPEGALDTV